MVLDVEAEEIVDFFLIEHAVGAAARSVEFGVVVVDHRRPLGSHRVGVLDALLFERGAPLGSEVVHILATVGPLLGQCRAPVRRKVFFVASHARNPYCTMTFLKSTSSTRAG